MKNKTPIIFVPVACFIVAFTLFALISCQNIPFSEEDFPLELDLDKTVFNAGEKISFNATIINKSGKDVNMFSNGQQPWVIFRDINDDRIYAQTCLGVKQIFKANEKITRSYEYEAVEAGTYIVDARYSIIVSDVRIENKLDDIIVEIK